MPFMRRRPLLRAAAVGGGAYAYGKHRERMQSEQQQEAYEQGQASATGAAPAPAPAAAGSSGITSQDTERLAEPDTVRDTERYAIRSYRRDDREGRRAARERSVVGAAHRSAGRGRAGRARCARRAGNADAR